MHCFTWTFTPNLYFSLNFTLVYSSFDVLYKCSFCGGIASIAQPFFVNISRFVSSMLFKLLVQMYRKMVNRFIVATTPSLILLGSKVTNNRTGVRFSNIFQISQAVFFPLVLKDDTVSHPVWLCMEHWQGFGSGLVWSKWCNFMSWNKSKVFICSKSNPQLLFPIWNTAAMAKTTTSVSLFEGELFGNLC